MMEEIKSIPNLPIGCKVFCYGYGMQESTGAVISECDSNGCYQCIYISDYNCGYFNLDKYARPHSKVFGIGNYFDDDLEVFDDSILEEYILKADIATKISLQAEIDKNTSDKMELEMLPQLYPHLLLNINDDQSTTKKNLVAELKKHFPLVKFSVKKEHHSTYGISWIDGVTEEDVQKIAEKFVGYKNDESGDFRDPCPSNFNKIFGDFKYIFYYRKASVQVKETIENFKTKLLKDESYNFYPGQTDDICYRIFRKTFFPSGSKILNIHKIENYSGMLSDSFEFAFDAACPINTIENTEHIKNTKSDFILVDYSERAVAVFGDTKSIKEILKELGGRFNPGLTYNDKKQCGWIFPKSKEAILKSTLNL